MTIETDEQYQEALTQLKDLVFDDEEQLLLEIMDYEAKEWDKAFADMPAMSLAEAKEIAKTEF